MQTNAGAPRNLSFVMRERKVRLRRGVPVRLRSVLNESAKNERKHNSAFKLRGTQIGPLNNRGRKVVVNVWTIGWVNTESERKLLKVMVGSIYEAVGVFLVLVS